MDFSGAQQVFDCPIPTTDAVYDTVACVCRSGWYGRAGVAWEDCLPRPLAANCTESGRFACAPCDVDFFSLAEFAVGCVFCSPECRYGHYLAAACTASSDATCRTCHPCPAGTWQTAACDAGGVGWAAAGALGSDAQCAPCSPCDLSTHYIEAECTATADTVCTLCSDCAEGEYVYSGCGTGLRDAPQPSRR